MYLVCCAFYSMLMKYGEGRPIHIHYMSGVVTIRSIQGHQDLMARWICISFIKTIIHSPYESIFLQKAVPYHLLCHLLHTISRSFGTWGTQQVIGNIIWNCERKLVHSQPESAKSHAKCAKRATGANV